MTQPVRSDILVSIRASAREATPSRCSRASTGLVSIRASAREATQRRGPRHRCRGRFNPRLRTGGDVMAGPFEPLTPTFQSAPPHGRRHLPAPCMSPTIEVSIPRLRTGGDARGATSRPSRCMFQSAPPHGRRHRTTLTLPCCFPVSIRASAREATEALVDHAHGEQVSIRASAREATRAARHPRAERLKFQSAPPHGRRPDRIGQRA